MMMEYVNLKLFQSDSSIVKFLLSSAENFLKNERQNICCIDLSVQILQKRYGF